MNLQYVTDTRGKTTAVLLPIKDWKTIEKKLSTADSFNDEKEPTKEEILAGLREALLDVKLHLAGKKKLKTAKELLDEL